VHYDFLVQSKGKLRLKLDQSQKKAKEEFKKKKKLKKIEKREALLKIELQRQEERKKSLTQ